MQVKCYKTAIQIGRTYDLDRLSGLIGREGSSVLNTWKNGEEVLVRSNGIDTESLFILGGRHSITHWLRTQGAAPRIGNPNASVWATYMRRKHLFAKDQTLVAISGDGSLFYDREQWKVSEPHKLDDFFHHLTTVERTKRTYTPDMLGGLLEGFFRLN